MKQKLFLYHEDIDGNQRGIMMVMLLVAITLVSIISLAVLPFFGTVRERAVQEDVENIVEQTRRAVYLATADALKENFDGRIELITDPAILGALGTAAGDEEINKLVKVRLMEVMNKGYMRKNRVNFTVVHNLIEESNFEFVQKTDEIAGNATGWYLGYASDAAVVGTSIELDDDYIRTFAAGVFAEHPNSFKYRDFRMSRRMATTARVTDEYGNTVDKSIARGGKFGKCSIAIWNPPESEVAR